ncbi:MAG: hypothetical protein LBQ62_08620, partial [Candidatus Accumulibacter sp.]|nr:hypothetical protein [Accumulibacter sp.]
MKIMFKNTLCRNPNDFFACENKSAHMSLSPNTALKVIEQAASRNLLIVWYESGIWHTGADGRKKGYEGHDTWTTRLNIKSHITRDELIVSNLAAQ